MCIRDSIRSVGSLVCPPPPWHTPAYTPSASHQWQNTAGSWVKMYVPFQFLLTARALLFCLECPFLLYGAGEAVTILKKCLSMSGLCGFSEMCRQFFNSDTFFMRRNGCPCFVPCAADNFRIARSPRKFNRYLFPFSLFCPIHADKRRLCPSCFILSWFIHKILL